MKYTSLLCAAVAAAALGSFAADGTRSPVVEEPFDAAPTGAMTGVSASIQTSRWTVNELDESAIIEGSITATEAMDGYTGKSLLLNTQGQELVVAAEKAEDPDTKSEIKMKIRLVASDTAPTIDAGDVHAAVYLLEQNPDVATEGDGLYAYSYVGIGAEGADALGNKWVALANDNFEVANGDLIALKVVMDYSDAVATYYAYNLGNNPDDDVADGAYIPLVAQPISMANSGDALTAGHLKSVAFKGTGSVDDLFITSIQQVATSATIVFNIYVGDSLESPLVGKETIDVYNFQKNFEEFPIVPDYGVEGDAILSVDIYKLAAQSEDDECIVRLDPTALYVAGENGEPGDYVISSTYLASLTPSVVLEAGADYEVRVVVGTPGSPSAYEGPKSGKIQILCDKDKTAYEAATDEDFVPLSFTSIEFVTDEVSGDVSIVAGFNATVITDDELPLTATFGVITSTALGGEETTLEGEVTVTATGYTVTIPMPAGDALFIKGFTTAPAPAGD